MAFDSPHSGLVLRNYQGEDIQAIRKSIANGNRSPLYVLPCGGGKTAVAAAMISGALRKGKRCLFLAPRRELIYQTANRLVSSGINHGIIMAGEEPAFMPDVQVACIPTLHRRSIQTSRLPLPPAELVLCDEAHIGIGGQAQELIERYRASGAIIVGLTATPARADGRGLGMIYDDLVEGPSVRWLTDNGYLVPAVYYAGTKADLEGVGMVAGDYNKGQLADRIDQPKLIGDVVENWARIAPDRQTFVFSLNVAHSRHLADRFMEIGVSAEHLDGKTPTDEREAIQKRLRDGITQVICNCEVMTYGVDFPPVSCIVLATPTKSVAKYLQMVGRGARTSKETGKTDFIVIDHGGISDALGYFDDPMPWSLDGKEKVQDRKEALPKKEPRSITCVKCSHVFRAAPVCPRCGHEMRSEHKKAVETLEAELVQIDRERQRKEGKAWTMADKAKFYAELKGYCQERQKSQGYAAHLYRDKLGVWPNDPTIRWADPVPPSMETVAYITSRNIARAKRVNK